MSFLRFQDFFKMSSKLGYNISIFIFGLFTLFSLAICVRTIFIYTNSIETTGSVAYKVNTPGPRAGRTFSFSTTKTSVIYFYTETGKQVSFEGCSSCYKEGQEVKVAYLPNDPTSAIVKDTKVLMRPFYYLIGFSVFLFLTIRRKKKFEAAYTELQNEVKSHL